MLSCKSDLQGTEKCCYVFKANKDFTEGINYMDIISLTSTLRSVKTRETCVGQTFYS